MTTTLNYYFDYHDYYLALSACEHLMRCAEHNKTRGEMEIFIFKTPTQVYILAWFGVMHWVRLTPSLID